MFGIRRGYGKYCSRKCAVIGRGVERRSYCVLPAPTTDSCYITASEDTDTVVSPENYEWATQFMWHLNSKGYASRNVYTEGEANSKQLKLHYALGLRILGRPLARGEIMDHEDRVKLNNRRINLRLATKNQNDTNKGSARGLSSIYKGVSLDKRDKKWVAGIRVNKLRINIGRFVDELEAAYMYDCDASALQDSYAVLNFRYVEVESGTHSTPVELDTSREEKSNA
mgnify:CR=1 FL=1